MKQLHLSEDLSFPINVVTQRLGWIGTTGSGKTYGAGRMAELMIEAKAQIVVLDPVGVWYGLRLNADGKSPGISIPVFGGLHGDVPLESTGGRIMADLVVDQALSMIIDVSQFEYDTDKARFASDFINRFFFRKKAAPSAVHIFLEEAQEMIPQNPQKGEEKMLHAFIRAWKIGRNFGIGGSIISQRPQEVNKKALNLSQTMFAFQTNGSHERKAIEEWMKDKNLDLDLVDELPKLKVGQPYVWAPGWLSESKIIRISKKWTYNASSTPEVGEAKVEARHLAPIEVAKLSEQMKSSIEKAKANDPDELKKRIRELEAEKRLKLGAAVIPVDGKVLDAKLAKEIEKLDKSMMEKRQKELGETIRKISKGIEESVEMEARNLLNNVRAKIRQLETRPVIMIERGEYKKHEAEIKAALSRPDKVMPVSKGAVLIDARITSPQQKILDSLAWWKAFGHDVLKKAAVAFVSVSSPKSSGFTNNLGALRSAGLIQYPSPGMLGLTEEGLRAANYPSTGPTAAELERRIDQVLSRPLRQIFDYLWNNPDSIVGKIELAEAIGISAKSSGYTNNLGRLRSLHLCEYPSPGMIRLARWIKELQ